MVHGQSQKDQDRDRPQERDFPRSRPRSRALLHGRHDSSGGDLHGARAAPHSHSPQSARHSLGKPPASGRLRDHGAARAGRTAAGAHHLYRALEFLCGNGFVHRIESRNAYLACVRPHFNDDPIVFLICERCGAVGEASSPEVASTLKAAARVAGFTPKSPVIEIGGICMHCVEQTTEDG